MTPNEWDHVKEVFNAALGRDREERSAFLDVACDGNAGVREEVESLLAAYDGGESFLETPVIGEPPPDPEWRLRPGQVVSHFEVISAIASGGMGEIYLAEDLKLRRRVALKVLPERMNSDADRFRRFQREARAVSTLNHPNILTIFEFDEEGPLHVIASEYVEGETLRRRLKRGRLSSKECLAIGSQIASALHAAHSAGVIHRDIKPENVMVRRDGLVKVLDFGLAKLGERPAEAARGTGTEFVSHPGMVMGTAAYMSPEQARGIPIDERTDIFSLGVVLYEMLFGKPPFTGATTADVIAGLIRTDPPPIGTLVPGVPDGLEKIVRKALAKDRDERYATAADMLEDLERIAGERRPFADTDESPTGAQRTFKLPQAESDPTRTATPEGRLAQPTLNETADRVGPGGGRMRRAVGAGALSLLIAGAVAFWVYTRAGGEPDPSAFERLRPVRIVSWKSGQGTFSTNYRLSHDGRMLAYSSTENGVNAEIYVKQTAKGDPVRVTGGAWDNSSPLWSPDDQTIAFVSRRDGEAGIFTSPTFGGPAANVRTVGAGFLSLSHWSSDGRSIYYDLDGNLFRLDLATKESFRVTDLPDSSEGQRYFRFSPDEQLIAYCDNRGESGDMWVISANGGEPTRVTDDPEQEFRPAWHPDGKRIYYSVIRDGRSQINVVGLSGGAAPVQVTRGEGSYELIDLSPDGTKLYFTSWEKLSDVWGVPVNGGSEGGVATGLEAEFWPNISPDGRSIVYQVNEDPRLSPALFESSFVVRPLASQSAAVAAKGYNPSWLPDGSGIVFLSWREDEKIFDLWVADLQTGAERQITSEGVAPPTFGVMPLNRGEPGYSLSPDGAHIAYLDAQRRNIWIVPSRGEGERMRVGTDGSAARLGTPVWSPDGMRLAFVARGATGEGGPAWSLWSGERGKPPTRIITSAGALRLLGWSRKGDELIFLSAEGEITARPSGIVLTAISPAGVRRSIATIRNAYATSAVLSPDGATVAYSARRDGLEDVWSVPVGGKGGEKKITNNRDPGVFLSSPAWAPDGGTIFFDRQQQNNSISMFERVQ